jgi:hypothetical protein
MLSAFAVRGAFAELLARVERHSRISQLGCEVSDICMFNLAAVRVMLCTTYVTSGGHMCFERLRPSI